MSTENGLRVFSIRLPASLGKQIDDRAIINRRTRNAEIVLLLEQAIDSGVSQDIKMLKEHQSRVTLE